MVSPPQLKAPLHTPWHSLVSQSKQPGHPGPHPQLQFLPGRHRTSGTHAPTRPSPKRDSAVGVPGPAPAAPGAGSCRVQRAPAQPAGAGPRVFAVPPPCLQCTQPRFVPGGRAVAVGTAWAQRAPWLLSAGSAGQALPCPCPCRVLRLCPCPSPSIHSHRILNSGTAPEPSQPFPSALTLAAPHFPTLDLLSSATSFPRACPHILFPRRSCHGLCHPSCHGHSILTQAQILPPALQGWPCHPSAAPCRVQTGLGTHEHPWPPRSPAGGRWVPRPRWAAGHGRTQPYWDLWGWPCCFGMLVLGLAPVYWFVASLNQLTAVIRCGMSGIL